MSFDKKWDSKNEFSNSNNSIKNSDPLKSRLNSSINRIELENQRLEQAATRFQNRGKVIFDKVVDSYSKHDTARANIYANELAEIRKIEKLIFNAKLTLEQLSLRLKTMTELGDVAYTLLPVVNVMKDIKSGIDSINPQTEKELDQINNFLSGIVIEAGVVTGMNFDFDSVNMDSSGIMEEAQILAESRIKDTLVKPPGTKMGQQVGNGSEPRDP